MTKIVFQISTKPLSTDICINILSNSFGQNHASTDVAPLF